jgi:hypothetical protein
VEVEAPVDAPVRAFLLLGGASTHQLANTDVTDLLQAGDNDC